MFHIFFNFMKKISNSSLSRFGSQEIVDGTEATPPEGYYFGVLQVVSATVVSAQGDVDGAINADLTAFTELPIGFYYGKWNSITLTSGEVIVHYAQE